MCGPGWPSTGRPCACSSARPPASSSWCCSRPSSTHRRPGLTWFQKVTLLNRDVGVNEISLRALLAGADNAAGAVLQARVVIYIVAEIVCIACVAWLARRRPLHQAMILAMPLVLVISNPSNYYSHFVFLLALLADVRRRAELSAAERPDAGSPRTDRGRRIPLVIPFLQGRGPAARALRGRLLGVARSGSRSTLPGLDAAPLHRLRLALHQPAARRSGDHRVPGGRAAAPTSGSPAGVG